MLEKTSETQIILQVLQRGTPHGLHCPKTVGSNNIKEGKARRPFCWASHRGGGNTVETSKLFIVLLFLNTIFGSFNVFNSGEDNNNSVQDSLNSLYTLDFLFETNKLLKVSTNGI